jgi:hypothetical protein
VATQVRNALGAPAILCICAAREHFGFFTPAHLRLRPSLVTLSATVYAICATEIYKKARLADAVG